LGFHWAHEGSSGRGASMAGGGGGGGVGAGACATALPFRLPPGPGSGRLWTVRQPGRAGASGSSSRGGLPGGGPGGGPGGPGGGGMSSSGRYLGRQSGEYSPPALCFALTAINSAISCCSARRSSRSFPTSWRRIRTSLASALLKSIRYLGVALGEKATPDGLLDAIRDEGKREEEIWALSRVILPDLEST